MTQPDRWRQEFPQDPGIIYLNHAAVAPLTRRAADAVSRFAANAVARGAADYLEWMKVVQRLREDLATLVNAPSPDDIALVKNTSEGLSIVAHGFPWQAGDVVVHPAEEFPSNRVVWESLDRYGVSAHAVELIQAADPEQTLLDTCNESTRMLAVSAVQFASGMRLDLARLGRECRRRDIAFCVDGIQALGAIACDVDEMYIDFLAADAHKWLLGPEGIGLFYCHPRWRDQLTLRQFGWHMRENDADYDTYAWEPARSARRFECGSLNVMGIHAFEASLGLLLEIGVPEVERRLLGLTEYLFDRIERRPDLELLTRASPGRYAGITTFRSLTLPNAELYRRLRAAGVVCAKRGAGIRFSPHFYMDEEDLERALACVPAGAG